MQISNSTKIVFNFVENVKLLHLTKSNSELIQKIPLDEQTKNDFELYHNTKLREPMIYLEPDSRFSTNRFLLAYAIANEIHIKKSKYNPGSTETQEILEHELTHVQQYSEGRDKDSIDELELEANLNEKRHIRNGEEVYYIEYYPGKYCQVTMREYKQILNEMAYNFESKIEQKLNTLKEEDQLKFLIELKKWTESYEKKFFDVDRWC